MQKELTRKEFLQKYLYDTQRDIWMTEVDMKTFEILGAKIPGYKAPFKIAEEKKRKLTQDLNSIEILLKEISKEPEEGKIKEK